MEKRQKHSFARPQTRSSARKLKQQSDVNLLPGRVIAYRLDGFSLFEFADRDLDDFLHYGSLPEIAQTNLDADKEEFLKTYVEIYLEEEIRKEASLRKLPDFYRFLEHAAQQSGKVCSYSGISQEIGVSHVTVKSYYEILETTLIADRIDPIFQSKTRKKLVRSPRYLFFDLGVRRIAAKEGAPLSRTDLGHAFEQFVGIEILKFLHSTKKLSSLHFWQDPQVADVDWVVKTGAHFLPIEVKLGPRVKIADCKHLLSFTQEYSCPSGAIVIYCGRNKIQLADNITAWPWQQLPQLLSKI